MDGIPIVKGVDDDCGMLFGAGDLGTKADDEDGLAGADDL